MGKQDRPMLSTEDQIKHLKKKGVKFELISEEEATEYLKRNNNYFKLRAYRKNFPKHPDGQKKDQYIDLDFAQLKDLAIIDMRMRYVFLQMALDIEHFAKVRLLRAIEDSDDDGYQIVEDYMAELDQNAHGQYERVKNEIKHKSGSSYCGGIIQKYDPEYPVWAFVEIIPLGTFIFFYKFCAQSLGDSELMDDYYLLTTIKELRNAAAHSNCLIYDMGAKDKKHRPNYLVSRALKGISRATKRSQLSNERMRQMITLLYTHSRIVNSEGVRQKTKDNLKEISRRMDEHIDYYKDNAHILKGFEFFQKCVDILF